MFRKRSSVIRALNRLFYLKVGGLNPSAPTNLYRGSSKVCGLKGLRTIKYASVDCCVDIERCSGRYLKKGSHPFSRILKTAEVVGSNPTPGANIWKGSSMVEQRLLNPCVGGSNPLLSSNWPNHFEVQWLYVVAFNLKRT